MTSFYMELPGDPTSWSRGTPFLRPGARKATTITPTAMRKKKKWAQGLIRQAMRRPLRTFSALNDRVDGLESLSAMPFRGLVTSRLVFVRTRTKRKPKFCSLKLWKSGERIPCPRIPDFDNNIKFVLDCLVKAGMLKDDGFIWRSFSTKWYAGQHEDPHTEILMTLDDVM